MPKSISKPDLVFTVLGLVGISTIVLPFVFEVSPLIVIRESYHALATDPPRGLFSLLPFAPIAAPFFLSIFISIASLRVGVVGRLSKVEAGCAWVVAALATAGTLRVATLGLILVCAFFTLVVVAVTTIIWAARLREVKPSLLAVLAMQWAYVVNGVFCLLLFGGWQVGAYLTLATVLVYLAHIATVVWPASSGHRAEMAA